VFENANYFLISRLSVNIWSVLGEEVYSNMLLIIFVLRGIPWKGLHVSDLFRSIELSCTRSVFVRSN